MTSKTSISLACTGWKGTIDYLRRPPLFVPCICKVAEAAAISPDCRINGETHEGYSVQLTGFIVMLSRQAKHLALAEEKTIDSLARFFASLRFAQNDKLPYSLNERATITNPDFSKATEGTENTES